MHGTDLVLGDRLLVGGNSDLKGKLDVAGAATITGNLSVTGNINGGKTTTISATTGSAIALAADANTDLEIGKQPAGTSIRNIFIKVDADTVTGGTAGDNLNISFGTAAGGAQIMAAKALLKDEGGAVTFADNNVALSF